jgi:phage-related protein
MVFDVTAVLKANVSNFTGGIKEAQSVFESFQSNSNRTFEAVSSGFQKAGTALTAGLTAPTIAGIGAVVKSYASLEQNLGGTGAVFGSFAKTVQNDAKNAYKNMGLSASDYMATANKMGSLFQGSGVSQQRSLKLTSKAMKRASDVASVMGVDMNLAMESISGAAKGNFTMMDNLGVAMNATTLEAYALEKGINFKWNTASNAEKAELAMKMFMDRTKQYDGNFLKESESTVSGSLDAMRGAFSNFVSGLGNPEADVAQLMNNLKTTIQNFVKNVGGVIKNIWDNLPLAPWQKWVGLIAVGAGPVLLAISGIMKGIGTLKAAFQGIGAVLTNPWGLALVALVALVAGFVHAYKNSEKFRNIVNGAVSAVTTKFNELKAKAQQALDYIKNALGKFNVGSFAPLIGGIGLFIASLMRLKGIKIPNPFSKFKPTLPKIPNPFTGLADMAKSAGSAVKNAFSGIGKAIGSAFEGIGTAISTVFQGIARAISMLNPAGIASFALGLAAITAALVALSAVQGMVIPFLQGLAQIFVQLVGGVLQSFASALATLAPVMTTIASALSMLSPLVVAFGVAFSMVTTAVGGAIAQLVTAISGGVAQIVTALTPIVQIISTTFVMVVSVISQAIVQIIQAIAPFIPSITTMFTTITTVVANAIVQIVQALAPFIPAVTQMVTALAPVLSQIVQAFSNLVSQISPIIDSITNLFKTLGEQISSILESAGSVVESFGSAIRNVLDGVAGIFDSIGNAAKNAGTGVKLMAQGIAILTGLPLGDMAATLAAVATGLTAIVGSGIGTAGAGLQAAGVGMMLIATAGMQAQVALATLPSVITSFTTSLTGIGGTLTTAGAAITSFAVGAVASLAGLSGASAQIASFTAMVVTIVSAVGVAKAGLASFNGQANAAGAALGVLGGRATAASSQIVALGAGITSAMANATTAITSAGTQMTVTMQSAMNQVVNVVRNGMTNAAAAVRNGASQMTTAMSSAGTQMVTAAQSMVNQTVSAVRNGRGAMQSAGSYMAQGLAVGMRSALSEVTAAANQLVAQAEKAAKAKAKIHSPSRLFRDEVGWWIGAGVSVGIDKSAAMVAKSVDFIKDLASPLDSDILAASDLALADMQASLSTAISVSPAPQTVSYINDNTANQNNLIAKIDELIGYVKDGKHIYMDGRQVGNIIDQRLGQNTSLGGRFAW